MCLNILWYFTFTVVAKLLWFCVYVHNWRVVTKTHAGCFGQSCKLVPEDCCRSSLTTVSHVWSANNSSLSGNLQKFEASRKITVKKINKKKELNQCGGQTTALYHLRLATADGTGGNLLIKPLFPLKKLFHERRQHVRPRDRFSPWNWSLEAITGAGGGQCPQTVVLTCCSLSSRP